jgi:hypothetical protein
VYNDRPLTRWERVTVIEGAWRGDFREGEEVKSPGRKHQEPPPSFIYNYTHFSWKSGLFRSRGKVGENDKIVWDKSKVRLYITTIFTTRYNHKFDGLSTLTLSPFLLVGAY